MLSGALALAVQSNQVQAAWGRRREVAMPDDERDPLDVEVEMPPPADVHQVARDRTRRGLPYLLPDRPGMRHRPVRRRARKGLAPTPSPDTPAKPKQPDKPRRLTPEEREQRAAAESRERNTLRQNTERRWGRRRRAALEAGRDVPTPEEPAPSKRPLRRRSGADDPLLDRAVPLVPVYQQIERLCREQATTKAHAEFIADYCLLLATNDRHNGRGVTRRELAELAAEEPYQWSVQWAYKLLRWAHRLFAEWAFAESQTGHLFTPTELAPLRRWVESMKSGGYAGPTDPSEPEL